MWVIPSRRFASLEARISVARIPNEPALTSTFNPAADDEYHLAAVKELLEPPLSP